MGLRRAHCLLEHTCVVLLFHTKLLFISIETQPLTNAKSIAAAIYYTVKDELGDLFTLDAVAPPGESAVSVLLVR